MGLGFAVVSLLRSEVDSALVLGIRTSSESLIALAGGEFFDGCKSSGNRRWRAAYEFAGRHDLQACSPRCSNTPHILQRSPNTLFSGYRFALPNKLAPRLSMSALILQPHPRHLVAAPRYPFRLPPRLEDPRPDAVLR